MEYKYKVAEYGNTHAKFLFKIDLKYLHLIKLYLSSLQMYNEGSVL